MPKRLIRFNIPQQQSKQELFLKDPRADFIVILEKKIFPLHKDILTPSLYFQQLIKANKKSVAINTHFDVESFQQILGCFYGIEAAFERHNLINNVIGIISFLKVTILQNELITDMNVNFQEYGLFNLFYLSKKFNLTDIQTRCIKQLIDQDFQQINYNRYDLFQLDVQLFIFVLKQHERLKNIGSITGLDAKDIKAVCDQYCKTNSVQVNIEQIFKYGQRFTQQAINYDQEQKVSKRKGSWTQGVENKEQKVVDTSQTTVLDKKIISFEQKENQLIKIKLINSNMQQNNSKLVAQIRQVRSSINKNSEKQKIYGEDDLQKKLKQFEQKSKNAHKKMQQLKNKMMRINLDDQENQNLPQIQSKHHSTTAKTNPQQNSQVLFQMAVLQKFQQMDSDGSDM